MTNPSERSMERAQTVAESLFVNGAGKRATRLLLVDDNDRRHDLGGWSIGPVRDRIAAALDEAIEEAFDQRDKVQHKLEDMQRQRDAALDQADRAREEGRREGAERAYEDAAKTVERMMHNAFAGDAIVDVIRARSKPSEAPAEGGSLKGLGHAIELLSELANGGGEVVENGRTRPATLADGIALLKFRARGKPGASKGCPHNCIVVCKLRGRLGNRCPEGYDPSEPAKGAPASLDNELQAVIDKIRREYGDDVWTWEQCGQKDSCVVVGITDPPVDGELRGSDYYDEDADDWIDMPQRYENLFGVEGRHPEALARFVVLAWKALALNTKPSEPKDPRQHQSDGAPVEAAIAAAMFDPARSTESEACEGHVPEMDSPDGDPSEDRCNICDVLGGQEDCRHPLCPMTCGKMDRPAEGGS